VKSVSPQVRPLSVPGPRIGRWRYGDRSDRILHQQQFLFSKTDFILKNSSIRDFTPLYNIQKVRIMQMVLYIKYQSLLIKLIQTSARTKDDKNSSELIILNPEIKTD